MVRGKAGAAARAAARNKLVVTEEEDKSSTTGTDIDTDSESKSTAPTESDTTASSEETDDTEDSDDDSDEETDEDETDDDDEEETDDDDEDEEDSGEGTFNSMEMIDMFQRSPMRRAQVQQRLSSDSRRKSCLLPLSVHRGPCQKTLRRFRSIWRPLKLWCQLRTSRIPFRPLWVRPPC